MTYQRSPKHPAEEPTHDYPPGALISRRSGVRGCGVALVAGDRGRPLDVRGLVRLSAAYLFGAMLGFGLGACTNPPSPVTLATTRCLTERTTLQLQCVADYATKAEIDACRAGVQLAHECVTDGGTE